MRNMLLGTNPENFGKLPLGHAGHKVTIGKLRARQIPSLMDCRSQANSDTDRSGMPQLDLRPDQPIGALLRRPCSNSRTRLVISAKPVGAGSAPVENWHITGRNTKNSLSICKFLTNWDSAPPYPQKPRSAALTLRSHLRKVCNQAAILPEQDRLKELCRKAARGAISPENKC